MVINANTVLHLNQTASAYAYYFMQGLPEKEVLAKIQKIFKVKSETAKADLRKNHQHHQHFSQNRKD